VALGREADHYASPVHCRRADIIPVAVDHAKSMPLRRPLGLSKYDRDVTALRQETFGQTLVMDIARECQEIIPRKLAGQVCRLYRPLSWQSLGRI
jgi:hypothetical protein